MLIPKPSYTKDDLFRMTLQQVNDFCTLNNLKVPKVRVQVCNNYGYFQPGANGGHIGINVKKTRMPVWDPVNPQLQSFPGNKSDRTVAGVLAHEVGHYVDINNRLKFNLAGKFRAIIGVENSVSSYDIIEVERVAEAFRLFILNPKLLEEGRPKAFQIIRQCLKPVHQLPWRVMFHYSRSRAKYIDWCEKWIDRQHEITKEAKLIAGWRDKYPNAAPRYIVGK